MGDVGDDAGAWPVTEDVRRNARYDRVDLVLREQPGVWRKVSAVRARRDAQRWREAGKRRGWVVKQVRTDSGWDVYGVVVETQGETQ